MKQSSFYVFRKNIFKQRFLFKNLLHRKSITPTTYFHFLHTFLYLLIFCTLPLCCSACQSSSTTRTISEFDSFTSKLFREEISQNTINLHFTFTHPEQAGITNYEITLGDFSETASKNGNARIENYLTILHQFNKRELPLTNCVTYDVLENYFTLHLNMADYFLYEEPLSPSSGLHAQLPMLLEEFQFYDEKDIQDYLLLLSQVEPYFAQIIDFEKKKSEAGLFMPKFACEAVIRQCQDFIASSQNHFLIETFQKRLDTLPNLSPEKKESYCQQNTALVQTDLVSAYRFLADEMSTLLGSDTNEQGLCYFPNGRDYYTLLVSYYTGSSDSIPDIQKAISQMRTTDLLSAAKLAQADPTLWEKCNALCLERKDPTMVLNELQQDMLTTFPAPPETSYSVSYIDECLANYVAPAYYITAPLDNPNQNSIHINADTDRSSLEYFTTLAHEGFPGHLYQTLMSYNANLPIVRNLVNCNGYVEGWATYVEMLSYQYADVDPTAAALLQKNQSAILSLYATSDLGIHYDGWSLTDTIAFWNGYGINDTETVQKIYEYIVGEPAVYLQYYVGYLEILELKEMAQKKYGNQFNEMAFHQALLDIGPAPFDIIETYFDAYYLR